jgi:tRNA (guanine37-N1)-methyltransferase
MPLFEVTLLTLFPEMFPGPLGYSLAGKALKKGIWSFKTVSLRDFGLTKHKNIDDKAYGGGDGLIMRPDVLGSALDKVLELNDNCPIYYPSPRGKILNQEMVRQISTEKKIIILCGRFEGIDERVIDEYNVRQVSVGDYVLSGGEVAAFSVLDSVIRLLPGVLVNQDTLISESFEKTIKGESLLEYPLYTKPFSWRGLEVPKILLSGNHQKIAEWKKNQSLEITQKLRPDLMNKKFKSDY